MSQRREVFVDTSAWIALASKQDAYHEQAIEVRKQLEREERRWVTTSYVISELVAGLLKRLSHAGIVKLVEDIRARKEVTELIFVDEGLECRGWELFKARPDKLWSLTDCISFVVMQERGIHEAFTTDENFEQAGFVRLLQ